MGRAGESGDTDRNHPRTASGTFAPSATRAVFAGVTTSFLARGGRPTIGVGIFSASVPSRSGGRKARIKSATRHPGPWHLGLVVARVLRRLPLLCLSLVLACASAPEIPDEPASTSTAVRPSTNPGSDRIDALLAEQWRASGIELSASTSDAEFLRRVSLDLIGRIPTRAEVDSFLAERAADKRSVLVDRLLTSDEFAEHWARQWADLLLPAEAKAEKLAREPLERYLATALSEGRAWDRVVLELLAGEGELDEQPELAYLAARGRGGDKPERLAELTSTSARVFLGSRIECAQCHDHPYDPTISREDFWSTVALFGRMQIAVDRDERPPNVTIAERPRGELRMAPDDVDLRKRAIAPSFLGEPPASDASGRSRREQLATWIVEDPRFAAATVGLTWTRLFGRGIVEPWDDLLGQDPQQYPALLRELADEFRTHDHDPRALIRTIVLSRAYQLGSRAPSEHDDETQRRAAEAAFARASVRSLSAEQLFDSLLVATGLEDVEDRAFARAVQQRERKALREYSFVFADDEMASADAFTGNVPQALLLLNGALTNQAVIAREGSALDELLELRSGEARIEALWRTAYARDPTLDERAWAHGVLGDNRDPAAFEDLLFAMLQSGEFNSNH